MKEYIEKFFSKTKLSEMALFAISLFLLFMPEISHAGQTWTQTFDLSGPAETGYIVSFNTPVRKSSVSIQSHSFNIGSEALISSFYSYGSDDPLTYGAVVYVYGRTDYWCIYYDPPTYDEWGNYTGGGYCTSNYGNYGPFGNGSGCGSCYSALTSDTSYSCGCDEWGNNCNTCHSSFSGTVTLTGTANYFDEPTLTGDAKGYPYGTNISVTTGSADYADPIHPVLNWTTAGNSQVAYRAQVWDSTWSSLVWDSGDVTSAATSVQVGTALTVGTTYHWRVAVAQAGWSGGKNFWTGFANDDGNFIPPVPAPVVDIKANASDGPVDVVYNGSATLSWTSGYANSCSVSAGGPVLWTGLNNASQSTGALTSSKTYALTCVGDGGTTTDSVIVNVHQVEARNLQAPATDYCGATGNAVTFIWEFYDSAGHSQNSYRLQLDPSGSDFASADVIDTCPGGPPNGTCAAGNSASNKTVNLNYGATYNWRVMVWDTLGSASSWASGPSITMTSQAWPDVNFTVSPVMPQIRQETQFTDNSTVSGDPDKATYLWSFNPSNLAFVSGTNQSKNPIVRFLNSGIVQVSLTVTDQFSHACTSDPLNVTISSGLPNWREKAPE